MPPNKPNKWPLPKLDSLVPPEAIKLEHKDYKSRKGAWKFFRESDELTGGYAASVQTYTGPDTAPTFKETYLIPHIKEADLEQFARRVAAARPPRFVKEGIESITGILTGQEPNRDNYPPKLLEWTSGVTIEGATLQQWIASEMWPLVERYGLCYSYARRPSVAAPNLKEQEDAIKDAGLPEVLLHIITPENMPWWSVDDVGQFEIVRYTEERISPTLVDGYAIKDDTFTRHWWVTREGWWYCDENKIVASTPQTLKVEAVGTWETSGKPLKHFPIVKWGFDDGVGPTETAAYAQLMYYRKDSELCTIEEASAFAMTWVPTTAGSDDPEETVRGPHQIGGWDPEGTGGASPMILETTGVSLTHFADKRLPQLEADAGAPYGINDSVGSNDSGVALAHIEAKAKTIYTKHSQAGSQSEFAGLQPVAELLGEELTDKQRAEWSTNFGTLSDASMSEILTAFAALEPGDEFMSEILSAFSTMLPSSLTAQRLEECIDAWTVEREEQKTKEAEQEEALFDSEGELRRAQTEKVGAEAKAVGLPFAANPASKGKPKERP